MQTLCSVEQNRTYRICEVCSTLNVASCMGLCKDEKICVVSNTNGKTIIDCNNSRIALCQAASNKIMVKESDENE